MDDLKLMLEDLSQESDSGAAPAVPPRPPKKRFWRAGAAAGIVLLVAAMAAVWFTRSRRDTPGPELVAVPLTSYPGSQDSPTFSPDGTQVAFAWCKEKEPTACSIYVKQIGVEPPSRLTAGAATDCCPAWSPDGRLIAFLRWFPSARFEVVLVPQRGGHERVLMDGDPSHASYWGTPQARGGSYLAWTPDSKRLAVPVVGGAWALSLVAIETGETHQLTRPREVVVGDAAPAFSPDGRTLAFSRLADDFSADLYVQHLGDGYAPIGDPEKLKLSNRRNLGAAWLPDGSEFVFSSDNSYTVETATDSGLWRTTLSKQVAPRRLAFAGGASTPAVSRQLGRLAYVARRYDTNIWRMGGSRRTLRIRRKGARSGSTSLRPGSTTELRRWRSRFT